MFQFRVDVPARSGSLEISFTNDQLRELKQRHGKVNGITIALSCLAWVALLADTPCETAMKPKRLFASFFRRLSQDYLGTVLFYEELYDEFVTSIHHTDYGLQLDHFIDKFKDTPVFFEYLKIYRDPSSNIDTITYLLSFLLFGGKIGYVDDSLDATALRGWHQVETRIGLVEDPPWLIESLRHIIYEIFSTWESFPFLPVHGSGAVAQQGIHGSNQKNASLGTDPRITRLYEWFGVSSDTLHPWQCPSQASPSPRTSRLKFVPKDMKKTRSICMEPVLLQYTQQGVRLGYEYNLSKSLLGPNVVLHDQGANRDGAIFGSEFSEVDTIDLSSASDSVRWVLIKSTFPPSISKLLAATRSTSVQLPDVEAPFDAVKFAPMGSALCFPVQCTVYSAVVILAALIKEWGLEKVKEGCVSTLDIRKEYRELFNKEFTLTHNRLQPFRVYGDDIICDSRITSITIDLLRLLGFQVNSSKSFTGSQAYRESCGVHALDGYTVTPLRCKIKTVQPRLKMDSLAGLIDLANRSYDYGYRNLRSLLIRFCLHYPILGHKPREVRKGYRVNSILFSSNRDDSFAIFSDAPHNTHLLIRYYDPDTPHNDTRSWYQRDEIKSITGTSDVVEEIDTIYDVYHYISWQRSRFYEGKDGFMMNPPYRTVTHGVRARGRWTPLEE